MSILNNLQYRLKYAGGRWGCYGTLGIDICVQIGRGKVGLWGNILVKSNIPKSKFYVFDIRMSYSQNIKNMRKIYVLGFSVQRLWGKSLEISRSFSVGPLSSKYNLMDASYSGLRPPLYLGLKYIFSGPPNKK